MDGEMDGWMMDACAYGLVTVEHRARQCFVKNFHIYKNTI